MPAVRIQDFSGVVPVKGDRALPDNYAVESINTWLYGQELRGVRPPTLLETLMTTTRTVLRIPMGSVGGDPVYPGVIPPPSYIGDSTWLQWPERDVDIVKSAMVEDKYNRYYFCSPSRGPEFNTFARMKVSLPPYKLGVKGPNVVITPGVAPPADNADRPIVGAPTGGTTPVETRSYVYTWINEFGEESAPSLPGTNTGNANGNWPISNIKVPPDGADNPRADGYPAYTGKRLYRTVTSSSGGFDYYKVADIPLANTTFSDVGTVYSNATILMNVTLESTSWDLPPATLQGWVAMPNGFLVGFDKPVETPAGSGNWVGGNTVYMSEAYRFHAWPRSHKFATESLVVGLGILGQTAVVCTQGYPATVTGVKPTACTFTKATINEPCMSRSSIVSTPAGVLYASQNGLINVGPNGITNVTEALVTREEWIKHYMPQYLRGVRYQNGYLALRMPPDLATGPSQRSAYFIDPTSLKVALTEFSDFGDMRNLITDFWSGEIFLLQRDGKLFHWDPPVNDAGGVNNDLMPVLWRSKEFQLPYDENFGAYAVYWDPARFSNNPYGSSVLAADKQVWLKVWANRFLVYDREVPRCGRPVRLPSGFKGDIWQFELRGRAPIYAFHVAGSMKELSSV